MRRKQSPNLDDAAIHEFVRLLDGWTGRLSWAALIEAIADLTRIRYTRQALSQHERLKLAFSVRRAALRTRAGGSRVTAKSLNVQALLETNARLEAERDRFTEENAQLLEPFVRWAYNAHTRGLREKDLNRPLPAVDRNSSLQ
jgi:hypothetical protein